MKRKLVALNLVLAGILAYAVSHLRNVWQAEKTREAAELAKVVKPLPPPPFSPLPPAPAVVPAGYADIAQKTLFDRSRNPNVVVEAPLPPPPKPMPPLPVYHGQMNIGSGPTAIFSLTPTSVHEAVQAGETIGQFKLVAVNTDEIAFEWEGKIIRKKVEELLDRTVPAPGAPGVGLVGVSVRTEQPAAPAPAKTANPGGPGIDVGPGLKACDPNDTNPAGTVKDGYRKKVTPTPFGNRCQWEAIAQ